MLLGVAALLWITSGAYASDYLQGRPNCGRFVVCWLITLTGCVAHFWPPTCGFYFLLALLTLGACGLVINRGTRRAWRAGAIYVGLALLAEAFLLMAFVLLATQIPGDSLLIRDAATALPTSPQRDLILALLIAGLGMKAGLVPFHFWMPLAYSAAPTPASAVLSGAVVKASILGMIRFLPLETALPDWGTALAAAGLFAAIYGVVIGITQRDPKVVSGLFEREPDGIHRRGHRHGNDRRRRPRRTGCRLLCRAPRPGKGALFLSIGVIAATGSRRLWPMLLPAAIIAVGLGGLPFTGGALAKIVADELLGDSTASTIATLSAVGTTLLMLQFLRSLARTASRDPQATAAAGLVWPWLATAAVSLVVPWTLFLTVPSGTLPDPLAPAVLWKALWPVLLGAILAIALWRWEHWLPRVPEGDVVVALDSGVQIAVACGRRLERADSALRQWPTAGVSLLILTIALGAALFAR